MNLLGFIIGTLAAVCFYVAALAPITNHQRLVVPVAGIVIDWIPVVTGLMTIPGDPSPILFAIHISFGVAGYVLLGYCLVGWVRDRNRSIETRIAFLGIWTAAYLAGVVMTVGATFGTSDRWV